MSASLREARKQAIARVAADGAVPLSSLCQLAGADERSLIRWIRDGRHGIHMDAILRGKDWFSSAGAVARFLGAVARVEDESPEEARQWNRPHFRREGVT